MDWFDGQSRKSYGSLVSCLLDSRLTSIWRFQRHAQTHKRINRIARRMAERRQDARTVVGWRKLHPGVSREGVGVKAAIAKGRKSS